MRKGLIILFYFLMSIPIFIYSFEAVVIKVADGDTVTVMSDGQKIRIRLYGIDTPEIDQVYGRESEKMLSNYVLNRVVEIEKKDIDRYKRMVAVIFLDGENINLKMLEDGGAWAYIQYLAEDDKEEYIKAEKGAKEKGLWQNKEAIPPWEYRKQKRLKNVLE